MMNIRLLEKTVRLVVDFLEAEGIMEETATIRERAEEWYNKTEIVDAEMLAAATITGPYRAGTTWDELLNWADFYFSDIPIERYDYLSSAMEDELLAQENFHIEEIEAALRDDYWR